MATRSGRPESWHHGAAAVVASDGRLIGRVGSAGLRTFLRSAAKPFQALPLVLSGGVDRWSLSAADLALICASHQGTQVHVDRVAEILERAGLQESALGCGAHRPFDRSSSERLHRAGREPSVLHNNCSGKHAGLLLACLHLDCPLESYLESDHPLQSWIRRELATLCRVSEDDLGIGVDGCGTPCFLTSLEALARAYAALADPVGCDLPAATATALQRVAEAMATAPEMISGPKTFTTRLIEVSGGRVLGKEGAEGVYAVAVRGPVALGLVLKIADGSERARSGVVLDLLRQLGSLSREELGELSEFHRPALRNVCGAEIGEVVADVELEEVETPPGIESLPTSALL